jgi:hypothetical protein
MEEIVVAMDSIKNKRQQTRLKLSVLTNYVIYNKFIKH